MRSNLKVIGITGGSGAGKGEVSLCFLSRGIKCLDTDKVSRSVCKPGKPCLAELVDYFGEGILNEDGTLNRRGLAALVFGEPDEYQKNQKLSALNRITHHYIIEAINDWLMERAKDGERAAVIDAPQLFESGFDRHCDYTVGVIADREVRLRRIIARDGITRESAEKRLAAQKTDDFFRDHCDFTVINNSGLDTLEGQVTNILRKINLA